MWGRSVFLGVSHSPLPRIWGPKVPESFWDPYLRRNGLTQSDKIWCADICGEERVASGSATPQYQGGGASASTTFLGPPTCAHTVWETATKLSTVIKLLGGPTTVKPTYIFACKIWIKFEWIDKIQWFFGECDNSSLIHLRKHKI